MWTRVWLLAGRASEMPGVGDYQRFDVGPESFLLVRQPDAGIRAFYNVCQHRGSRLTFAAAGTTPHFSCPYHSWRYGLDGRLVDAPDRDDFPVDPCAEVTLVEVACETFAGFVFLNMNPDCEPLADFLGPLRDDWERYSCADWARVTALSVRVPCNWKVLQDNFCESYHLTSVHPQLRDTHEEGYRDTEFAMSAPGHNRMIMKGATPSRTQYGDRAPLPEGLAQRLALWELDPADFVTRPYDARLALQAQMRALGPGRGHRHYDSLTDEQLTDAHHYNLFPNCSLTFGADGVLLQRMRPHPEDPNRCTFDHWYYAFVPDGVSVMSVQTNVRVDGIGAELQEFDYGEHPMGIIPDQDVAITTGQQLGVRSRGYRAARLAGQETRIARFHHVIDEYLAGVRS
jgi:phenylpropionate dioxygenase-like ring-hydroxylating dioxygenase large terminal subunit